MNYELWKFEFGSFTISSRIMDFVPLIKPLISQLTVIVSSDILLNTSLGKKPISLEINN